MAAESSESKNVDAGASPKTFWGWAWWLWCKIVEIGVYILDLADDVLVAIKEMLPSGEKLLRGIMGSTFGLLFFYLAFKAWWDWRGKNWWYGQENEKTEEMHRAERRNFLTFLLSLAGSGLALALILSAWTSLSVLGVAFFPFTITTTLLISAILKAINTWYDLQEVRFKQREHYRINQKLDPGLTKAKDKFLRILDYDMLECAAFALIVFGLGLGTFATLTGILATIEFPLALIVVGAVLGVGSKFHDQGRFHWMYRLAILFGAGFPILSAFIVVSPVLLYLSIPLFIIGVAGVILDYFHTRGHFPWFDQFSSHENMDADTGKHKTKTGHSPTDIAAFLFIVSGLALAMFAGWTGMFAISIPLLFVAVGVVPLIGNKWGNICAAVLGGLSVILLPVFLGISIFTFYLPLSVFIVGVCGLAFNHLSEKGYFPSLTLFLDDSAGENSDPNVSQYRRTSMAGVGISAVQGALDPGSRDLTISTAGEGGPDSGRSLTADSVFSGAGSPTLMSPPANVPLDQGKKEAAAAELREEEEEEEEEREEEIIQDAAAVQA